MQFNFVLTNHTPAALQALDDILRPLFFGLRAAGHGVVAGALQLRRAPAVNIVVEDFGDPAFVRMLADARAAWRDELLLGVLNPFAVEDLAASEPRRAGLRTVLSLADFAWTLRPGMLSAASIAPDRVAILGYGFHESLLGPRLISDPAVRDIDAVVYGQTGPRLDGLLEALAAAPCGHFPVRAGLFPDYMVADLLSRAKVVVLVGGPPMAEASLGPRALKAICNGALPVAEMDSIPGPLSACVESCGYEQMAAVCARIVSEGRFVERGLGALEQLRRTATMCDALAAALAVVARRARTV